MRPGPLDPPMQATIGIPPKRLHANAPSFVSTFGDSTRPGGWANAKFESVNECGVSQSNCHRCFQFAYLDRSFQTGRIGTEAWPQTRPLYNRLASLLLHDALPYERAFDKGRIE